MWYARVTSAPPFSPQWNTSRTPDDATPPDQVGWIPAVNIRETEMALTFTVELPGVELENLEVTADSGVLTIHGEKTEARKEGEEGGYNLVERSYGSFTRRFQLPQGVDEDNIQADVADGMLEVRIPKAALPRQKRIHVEASAGARSRASHPSDGVEPRKASPKKTDVANQLEATGI